MLCVCSVMKEASEDAEAEGNKRRVSLSTLSIWSTAKPKNPGRKEEERRQLSCRWDELSLHCAWPAGFRFALGTCSNIKRARNHFRT